VKLGIAEQVNAENRDLVPVDQEPVVEPSIPVDVQTLSVKSGYAVERLMS